MANPEWSDYEKQIAARNTYLLALDGDIDFKPEAVLLLVDMMKKNDDVGAACGRIHPIGSGRRGGAVAQVGGEALWLR